MLMRHCLTIAGSILWLSLVLGSIGSRADAAPFYKGKTLVVVGGRSPGGTGSFRTQAVAQYLRKYLPGNPTIVFKYMPGGGGLAAANHMANAVKRDGLTIANIGTGVYSNAILGTRGVRYKLDDFVFLGSSTAGGPYTIVIRPELDLDTVEKLKAYKGLRFAQRSVGHTMYILDRLVAFILDLKEPRWILGYSSPEIGVALERGEADARSTGLNTFLRDTSHWLKEGFTVPIVIRNTKGRGAEFVPKFPQGLPNLDQFADTELKRAVLQFHNSSRPGSSIFFAPKGIPETALKALKEAFKKTWKDPQFAKAYRRRTGEPADPVTGEEIERVLQQLPKDPKIMKVYKQVIGGGPLPSSK